ncbi:hypothetical protein KV102_10720 [Mumia sp. zg.B53]|uniref:hypothetical protein n=1 Tax=unclassified Mumia TaxID=2621872 RepID=UPI001C6DEEBB|nr:MULTISPECIES: hypothetical protein [unclassified Mumia]MBW9215314.1 hypothetical protein [Mumia sp. zg.B53]MDD9349211.1 hypothetical protein [Mumia sp.]
MSQETSAPPAPGVFTHPRRWIAAAAAAWIASAVVLVLLGGDPLPLGDGHHAPWSTAERLTATTVVAVDLALLSVVVVLLTRRHPGRLMAGRGDMAGRARARGDLLLLAGYAVVAQIVGAVLGEQIGGTAISSHLAGSIHSSDATPTVGSVLAWVTFNVTAYVVVPLWWFARRGSLDRRWFHSHDRRTDVRVVLIVLVWESAFQMLVFGAAFFALTGRQMAVGSVIALIVSFLGTVLPTLVMVTALVVPLVLRASGSAATAVVCGGLAYAALHAFDGWTDYRSVTAAVLSVALLVLQYLLPGMFKALLTVRTGNVWVHAWAYHAVAPHVWADTPLMVRVFGVR